jgi:cytoskeletal protein CcmA (bactofilin family)
VPLSQKILSALRGSGQQENELAGPGLCLHGVFYAAKDGIFRATLRGTLDAAAALTLDKEAGVEGNVQAARLSIAGTVNGQVTSRDQLTLLPGARVQGSLNAPQLDLQPGAHATGVLRIGQPPAIDPTPARPARART